jgi:hypothetical protein
MVTVRSTTFCENEDCPGHEEVKDYPGMKIVIGDEPGQPLRMVPEED